jgi:hypothetical protein
MKIQLEDLQGRVPRLGARQLSSNAGQIATNCSFISGQISPVATLGDSASIAVPSARSTIHRLNDKWLHWGKDIDVVPSFIVDNNHRIYYSGESELRQTDYTVAISGSPSTYPANYYKLGLPKPTNALTVAIDDSTGETVFSTAYVYTYVTGWGEESEPSEPTSPVDWTENTTTITLSGFIDPTTDPKINVTKYRLYRLVAGSVDSTFQLLDEINVGSSQYLDTNYDQSSISGDLVTVGWMAPIEGLEGLTQYGANILVAFKANKIYLSEPGYPYAWPYSKSLKHNVVGFGYVGNSLIILTDGAPYILTGHHPATSSLHTLPFNYPCLSKHGIVTMSLGVIYPSSVGLVFISSTGQDVILSKDLFRKEQWNSLDIENLHGFYHNKYYYGFFKGTSKGFKLNLDSPTHIEDIDYGTFVIRGGYNDGQDVYVFSAPSTTLTIKRVEKGNSFLRYIWRSKEFTSTQEISYSVAKIISTGSVNFKLFIDGELKQSQMVFKDTPFRLPSLRGRSYTIEVSCTTGQSIDGIILATSVEEL